MEFNKYFKEWNTFVSHFSKAILNYDFSKDRETEKKFCLDSIDKTIKKLRKLKKHIQQ